MNTLEERIYDSIGEICRIDSKINSDLVFTFLYDNIVDIAKKFTVSFDEVNRTVIVKIEPSTRLPCYYVKININSLIL